MQLFHNMHETYNKAMSWCCDHFIGITELKQMFISIQFSNNNPVSAQKG